MQMHRSGVTTDCRSPVLTLRSPRVRPFSRGLLPFTTLCGRFPAPHPHSDTSRAGALAGCRARLGGLGGWTQARQFEGLHEEKGGGRALPPGRPVSARELAPQSWSLLFLFLTLLSLAGIPGMMLMTAGFLPDPQEKFSAFLLNIL